jgi:glycosyl hydrolase family 2
MMHVIRLRAPWDAEWLQEASGAVRCTRHFNRPTGIEGGDRVWLVIEGLNCSAAVSLNDIPVGRASRLPIGEPPARFDITPHLQPRNRIAIDLADPTGDDPLASLGEVRLEIG